MGVPFDTPNFFLLKVALTSFNVGKVGGYYARRGEAQADQGWTTGWFLPGFCAVSENEKGRSPADPVVCGVFLATLQSTY